MSTPTTCSKPFFAVPFLLCFLPSLFDFSSAFRLNAPVHPHLFPLYFEHISQLLRAERVSETFDERGEDFPFPVPQR